MSCTASIGILGLGAFGRLASANLAQHADIVAHDPRTPGEPPVPLVSLDEVASRDVVILAVPVPALDDALRSVAPHLKKDALVCDVCSVKLAPVERMLALLPDHARILGTHPLFGPQTAIERGSISGQTIALCPVRIDDDTLARARSFLADSLGLDVVVTTPDEHDRQMALVQVITHLVGHAASEMNLPDSPLSTLAYQRLMQMKRNTEQDAPELFAAIQTLNPYARQARNDFLDAMRRVIERAEKLT